MSWLIRTYKRTGSTTHYACDDAGRFPLEADLVVTRPWAGGIRADFVLSPQANPASTITGLRLADAPHAAVAVYVGNLYRVGRRRLVVAVYGGENRERLHIAVHATNPRKQGKAVADAYRALVAHVTPPR